MTGNGQIEVHDAIAWHDGLATFRGFPVEQREVTVAGMTLQIASMRDATHLLDEPDCAKRFLDNDMAPYGVELWPSAMMLAEYLSSCDIGPHSALEIGCGLGLVSIVAARLGWSVVAGDHEPSALVFARHNAMLNAETDIRFIELDWKNPPDTQRFQRILGADILYQLSNHCVVLCCLNSLLCDEGVALIADPNRGVADGFAEAAVSAGFQVEVIPASTEALIGQYAEGRIFRLKRAF